MICSPWPQVLIEQYHAFAGADSMHHAAAAHLISAFRDNQAKMKALLKLRSS